MAANLDKLLEPGERVVWRYPRGSLYRHPTAWGRALLGLAIAVVIGILYDIASDPVPWLFLTLLGAGLGALIYGLAPYVFEFTSVVLTDRRVVHVKTGWRTTVTAIPLDAIRGLDRLPEDSLVVRGADRTAITVTAVQRPAELARALAAATGLPAPGFMTPKELLLWRLAVGAFVASVVTALLLFSVIFGYLALHHGMGVYFVLALLPAALGLMTLYPIHYAFGAMVGVVLGRAFMNAAERASCLWRDAESLDSDDRRLLAILLPFAALLYGQPMDNPNAGGEACG